jgi:hypothetical protein
MPARAQRIGTAPGRGGDTRVSRTRLTVRALCEDADVRLSSLGREVGFWTRGRLRWAPRPRAREARPLEDDLRALGAEGRARARRLMDRYPAIADWSRLLNPVELREDLYLLEALSLMVPAALTGPGGARTALDVGSKNGTHLPALHALCPCPWTLVELDAHRRYGNLVTRRSRGEFIAGSAPHDGCRYIAGSVLGLRSDSGRGSFDVITWTLPFVYPEPLAAWGLPDRHFQPAALLQHVLSLLSPKGALMITNQGEAERDEQQRLLAAVAVHPARITPFGPLDSPLSGFRKTRWGFRVMGG